MRLVALFLGTSMLAACSGAGPQTVSSVIAPSSGTGTGTGGTTSSHTFAAPTETKTYKGIGVSHSFAYSTEYNNITNSPTVGQTGQLYAGNATTARDSSISITYNPRDAIFDVAIADSKSLVTNSNRYQDPAHRTAFGGLYQPQTGTPNLAAPGIQYLEISSALGTNANQVGLQPNLIQAVVTKPGSYVYDNSTFFYQKPGTSTQYVTFAGFLRNSLTIDRVDTPFVPAVPAVAATPTTPAIVGSPDIPATSITTSKYNLSRELFVFGENTINSSVPTSGTGTFNGTMVGSMVFNDKLDTLGTLAPTYFQWLEGTAKGTFNFAASTFALDLAGNVFAPQLDGFNGNNYSIKGGATFNATGAGRIDLVGNGGFLGQFSKAWFVNPDASRFDVNIAGSSIDGAFYGPAAEEVGGSYRIVGGTPDERIDILGVFTGKK